LMKHYDTTSSIRYVSVHSTVVLQSTSVCLETVVHGVEVYF